MTTLLLIIIYLMTIGLGLPDSTIGSAWPSIYTELNFPVSYANFVTVLISLFTIISSYLSTRLIKKVGMPIVCSVSTLLTCIALLGFSMSNSIIAFCICAIPCGFGAGSIDAAINNYVSLHYSSFLMNLTHCFYGIGVALSPYLMSFALSYGNSWRLGYRLVFYIQLFIVVVSFIAIPLWKKVKNKDGSFEEDKPIVIPYKNMIRVPSVRTGWCLFLSTCALEFTCGTWACSYLVSQGLTNEIAARFLTVYYIGITLGRFSSGLLTTKLSNKNVVFIGYSFVLVAIVVFLLPINPVIKGFSLFFIGFGNGPTFPNIVYITPKVYGKKSSSSIISSWLVMSNLGVLVFPAIFGVIAGAFGLKYFSLVISVIYVIMFMLTIIYFKQIKNVDKYQHLLNCEERD